MDNSVLSVNPTPATMILETKTAKDAVMLMCKENVDCLLVISEEGGLSGILTDKDIVYKVVAAGRVPNTVNITEIMIKDPIALFTEASVNEALELMLSNHIRHLPVIYESEDRNDIYLLDLGKCIHYNVDHLKQAGKKFDKIPISKAIKDFPHINSKVALGSSIQTVAEILKESRDAGILVVKNFEDEPFIIEGLITTKDIVRKVLAADLSPNLTFVSQIMTKEFKSVQKDENILDSLSILRGQIILTQEYKLNHLPIKNGDFAAGLVDIMKISNVLFGPFIKKEKKSTDYAEIADIDMQLKSLDVTSWIFKNSAGDNTNVLEAIERKRAELLSK